MTYEPKPGTVAFRVLAHMQLLHKGSEISGPMLAQAIGCDSGAIGASMQPALKAGAIFMRQKGGHVRSPQFWSLVDHSEIPRPAVHSPVSARSEAAPAAQPVGHREGAATPKDGRPTAQSYIAAIERTIPPDPTTITPAPKPSNPVANPEADETLVGGAGPAPRKPDDLRIALWSDGRLHIIRPGGHAVVFQRDEARAIVDYLNAISLEVLE